MKRYDFARKVGAGSWWSKAWTHHGDVGFNAGQVKRRPYLDGVVLVRRPR